ncbi:MAG: enolase C-terminal domain-like protein [Zavarzinella sp.]
MKPVSIVAHKIRLPLKKVIKHASHVRHDTENIIVRVQLPDGTGGWGEGVPREYVTGESADVGLDLLTQAGISDQLAPVESFSQVLALVEKLELPTVAGDDRRVMGNAARCALELALLDAYGKVYGEPLCNVAKELAPELYQFQNEVYYSGAITSARKGLKIRLASWRMRIYGFRSIKVKVGMEGYDDPKRLRMIRNRVGKNVALRVDANEAWSPDEAVAKIQELEPSNLISVEQPIPHENCAALPAIRKQVKTPIMLDESLCGMIDARTAAENGYADAFNLRISKCGGLIPTIRLAQFAQQHGIRYQLGCQVGESAILSAAGRQFATCIKDLLAIEGSFDRHLVQYPLSKEDITFGYGGKAPAIVRTGLGIDVQAEWIERLSERQIVLCG